MSNTKIPSVLWSADQTGVLSSDDVARAKANIGLATAVVLKGNATVSDLNDMTPGSDPADYTVTTGWQYTMTDAGTLTVGTLVVTAGDKVVWNGTEWEMAGSDGGGSYVIFASHNTETDTWTWPTTSEFRQMYKKGTGFLCVSTTNGHVATGRYYYTLTYYLGATSGTTYLVFTGSTNSSVTSNISIYDVEQISITISSRNVITYEISSVPEVCLLKASYVENPSTWTWPEKTEFSKAMRAKATVLQITRSNPGGSWTYYYYLEKYTPGSGDTIYTFSGYDGLRTGRVEITVPASQSAITAKFDAIGQTYMLNAIYNEYADTYTWPSRAEVNALSSYLSSMGSFTETSIVQNSSVILKLTYVLRDGPAVYQYYYLTAAKTGNDAFFGGSFYTFECLDYNNVRWSIVLSATTSSPDTVTGTRTRVAQVNAFNAKSQDNDWPSGNDVKNSKGLVQITNGSSSSDSETVFYHSGNGQGGYSYRAIPWITDTGAYIEPVMKYNSNTSSWSYEAASNNYLDYRVATLAYMYNEPNWTASHLIYYAGQNIPSASEIHFSKCTRGKMYTVHHCSKNSVDFKLTNDLADGTTLTVYDGSASAYQLTTGYSIILFPANCTKSITATFMIYNTSLYITYGY